MLRRGALITKGQQNSRLIQQMWQDSCIAPPRSQLLKCLKQHLVTAREPLKAQILPQVLPRFPTLVSLDDLCLCCGMLCPLVLVFLFA